MQTIYIKNHYRYLLIDFALFLRVQKKKENTERNSHTKVKYKIIVLI